MKKLLGLILTSAFLVAFSVSAQAVTIESQSNKSDLTQTFVITANPRQPSTALQLRLRVTGGTITSFTPGSDNVLAIGTCDSDSNLSYTSDTVCVDLATVNDDLQSGQVVGVMVIERDSTTSQLKITKDNENAYLNENGDLTEDTGVAFTLYGAQTSTKDRGYGGYGLALFFLLVTFLTGAVFGTTMTTLGHVLQNGKKKKS